MSGNLTNSLEQALKYLEDSDSINRTLRGILIPNLVQFVFLVLMLIVGTVFALPAIENLYVSMGSNAELPAISIWFSNVVRWLITFWYIPAFIIIRSHSSSNMVCKYTKRKIQLPLLQIHYASIWTTNICDRLLKTN